MTQLHPLTGEPYRQLRGCCTRPLASHPSRASQLSYPRLFTASHVSAVTVLICFLNKQKSHSWRHALHQQPGLPFSKSHPQTQIQRHRSEAPPVPAVPLITQRRHALYYSSPRSRSFSGGCSALRTIPLFHK